MKPGPMQASEPLPIGQRYYSRAIGNALRILELLQMSDKPIALAEIARRLSLPKSSVFRTLCTLEIAGYIRRLEDDRFSIESNAVSPLNRMVKRVVDAAESTLKSLGHEFRETISLAIPFDNRIEVVSVIDSPHRVRMGNMVGDILPPHASSLGKCLTALLPESHRSRLLRAFGMVSFTPHTITEEAPLCKEFDLVRARGYATDIEESVLGGCCVSAPVIASHGQVAAAVSISMPKMRFARRKRMVAALMSGTRAIASSLAESTRH